MHAAELEFSTEAPHHAHDVEEISAEAFGPGRFARAAARVREMTAHAHDLSFVVCLNGKVVGSVRQTLVRAGERPVVMLGPLAVRPAYKGQGLGAALMGQAADAAKAAGEELIFLVGDRPYYMPLGYMPVPRGTLLMPGPVDPDRILALPLKPGAMDGFGGRISARIRA
ncbi:N-acetyltransferase [Aureimonas fodinaquatilis]|uniref:N-acetyltransferase n=1 Tax=Aureimonas fodinaquatilis TaxID=2565783 RepID=A0A5B0E1Z4_9HYPH|nr:N-acetyltransferase [Aureimonas fodinaquatilis]